MASHNNPSRLAKAYFVLSAGRTGTVFLSNLLRSISEHLHCFHEPPPARYELVLGNAANDLGVGSSLVRRLVLSVRRHRLCNLEDKDRYIEVNPLLCPAIEYLPELVRDLRVIHIVRHPRDWAQSILAFKASGYRRFLVDYIPFGRTYPQPRPHNWRKSSPAVKALWQWRTCNEQILTIQPYCHTYLLLRYEDLFLSSDVQKLHTWRQLFASLDLQPPTTLDDLNLQRRTNAAPIQGGVKDSLSSQDVGAICGQLVKRFGYSLNGR